MPREFLPQTPEKAQSFTRDVLEHPHRDVHDLPIANPRSVHRFRCMAFVGTHVRGDEKLAPDFGQSS